MNRRVVITGLGLVTPLAVGTKETWEALCAGKSGIAEITRFDTSVLQTKIAAEIKDFHPEDFLAKKVVLRSFRGQIDRICGQQATRLHSPDKEVRSPSCTSCPSW